ncbi:GNAT family N-acetyltransferase [Pseudomonas bharatica]|uniref:GNAT family N-acetyltransferase n=1 Tax=Pseudomonas bharatica TaxID=2692112 RepID=UPI003B2815FE
MAHRFYGILAGTYGSGISSIMENAPSAVPPSFADIRSPFIVAEQAARTAFFRALRRQTVSRPAPILSSIALKPRWAHLYFPLQDDPVLAYQVRLPLHASVEASRAWISRERRAGHQLYAVVHAKHGMVGAYGLRCWGAIGSFHFWLGKAFRGRGHGRAVLELVQRSAEAQGMKRLYSSVLADNISSLRVLSAAGFQCLDSDRQVGLAQSGCWYRCLGGSAPMMDEAVLHEEWALLAAAARRGRNHDPYP